MQIHAACTGQAGIVDQDDEEGRSWRSVPLTRGASGLGEALRGPGRGAERRMSVPVLDATG